MKKATIIRISSLISNVFNPLTSLLIFFIYHSYRNYTLQEAIEHFLPILLIMILPIVGWIVYNVKIGKYNNMDVSNRNQRKSLYWFIAIFFVIYLGFYYWRNNENDYIMLFLFILLLIMQLSNYFIKSSMHTAFNVYTAALFFSESFIWRIVWLGISILVGITRIILKRHSVKEVLMGFLLASLAAILYLNYV